MKMALKIVFALAAAAALCCAQGDATSSSGVPAKDAPVPVPPTPVLAGEPAAAGRVAGAKRDAGHKAYVIGPLDVLTIKVWNNANLSGLVSVDSDGMISIPLI